MKCPNCGFESNENFCQMCGTKMIEDIQQTPPEPMAPPMPTGNENNPFFNEPQQNSEPMFNNPYTQPNQYRPNYNQAPQSQPPYPDFSQAMPPQNHPQPQVPKKKTNVALIIIICIISTIIVAGLFIGIYSTASSNKNIIDEFLSDDFNEDYYNTITDSELHKLGEYSEFDTFKVTLKNVKKSDIQNKNNDTVRTDFTVEIENTSNNTISFYYVNLEPISIYGDEFDYTSSEWLNEDINYNNNNEISIKPSEKFEFSVRYAVSNDIETIGAEVNLSSTYDNCNDYYASFSSEK